MNKRSFLELTPLLDVILIMFFAVLISINTDTVNLNDEMTILEDKYKIEKNKNDDIEETLYKIFSLNSNQIKEYEEIDKMNIIEQLKRYKEMSDNISFIDIGIKGEYNKIYFNNESTNIFIPYEDIETTERRNEKKKQIVDVIEDFIKKEANKSILMISLNVLDKEVYRYGYILLNESIDEVIHEYGEEKVIKREVYSYEEGH